jgi:hypothetical protein
MRNGEGRIRTRSFGEAKRNLPRQVPLSNKQGLSQDPPSFPQAYHSVNLAVLTATCRQLCSWCCEIRRISFKVRYS